ncbi:MAG: elongation factor P maturation arginine rhamnosyltransferase EarP [Treponemataceae bacterium]|nr:elongation factor P maturation arginine rhamnosyltransferase EarP [Treponemataceae bacterium]
MPIKNTDITLLCRVIDNYGDIGVVFRLAKALSKILPEKGAGLRLIVDNLTTFSELSPGLDPSKKVQKHRGWTVCQWDAAEEGRALYEKVPPLVILECFACGRPEWLDDLLFDKTLQARRPKPVQIINLEYLTAEPYAEDFHKLQSLTRSAQVRKVNFMPGFTEKTGGLILDENVQAAPCGKASNPDGSKAAPGKSTEGKVPAPSDCKDSLLPETCDNNTFSVLIFSYQRDFTTIAEALAAFSDKLCQDNSSLLSVLHSKTLSSDSYGTRKIRLLSAPGKSRIPFSQAWGKRSPSPEELPFLPQDQWDKMLYQADFLFIRGEDSLSRACLSGKPFVWQAYPQSEMYHLVKVQALLDRMERHFSHEDFILLRDYWLWYNGKNENKEYDSKAALLEILIRYDKMKESFTAFSKSLLKNGNLADHLMTFIEEIV